tara:strand:+ start:2712 stop:3494 length:783 start_codon:yes stop_codon:yes gene_type:complete
MWCNVGFAEQIKFKCSIPFWGLKGISKEDQKRFKGKIFRLLLDTDKMILHNIGKDDQMEVLHGIIMDGSVTVKNGVNENGRNIEEKVPKLKDSNEVLIKAKNIVFKFDLTDSEREPILTEDYKEFKKGQKININDVKDFTLEEVLKLPIEYPLKHKLDQLYEKYKVEILGESATTYGPSIEEIFGNVFYYESRQLLKGTGLLEGKSFRYKYRGHIYYGAKRKKGFVIKIWGPRMDSMKIKNFFDNSHFYQNALQFNFSCK